MKSFKCLIICMFLVLSLVVTPATAKKTSPTILTVTIGDIISGPWDTPGAQVIADLAMADINSYFVAENKPYRLQYEIQDAGGRNEQHQDRVVDFAYRQEPVNLLLAGRYSGMALQSLPYCNAFDVLMVSPSSTSPTLSIPDDNLFRLCPPDTYTGSSLAHVVWSKGIEHVVFLERSDAWADTLFISFIQEYAALGGSLTGKPIRYLDYDPHYAEQLQEAEVQAVHAVEMYGASKVGVVAASFSEAAILLNMVKNSYPTLYNCTWFGGDGSANSWDIVNNAAEAAEHVKYYSLMQKEVRGPNWESVASRYAAATNGEQLNVYRANEYDIFWIYALSIEKASSADPADVRKVLPKVAAKYDGITGNCRLNDNGDRLNQGFDIWSYRQAPPSFYIVGSVDASNSVNWLP